MWILNPLNLSKLFCYRALAIALGFLFFMGCQTPAGVVIQETPLSISETRRVIVIVIGEPIFVSEHGRDLVSKYYDRRGKYIEKGEKPKERTHTTVTILGDRRPYDLVVNVIHEAKLPDGHYEITGPDEAAARRIATDIKKVLNQSRDNRNVIDDFKPY